MAKKTKSAKKSTTAKKPKSVSKAGARRNLSIATSSRNPPKQRMAAMAESPLAVCESDASLQAMLKVLRDKAEPIDVRLTALQSLQAASFSVVAFESCRRDYTTALRQVATDPDPELRQRSLGILAREKDGFAQKKLIEGLRNAEKALVPPEKALQLLSNDIHAEAYPIAREILKKPPNEAAKREAIRLLASDATSAPMIEKILRDKGESNEIRQVSAAALNTLKPENLQAYAREALLDESEADEIQGTSLTALTQFGDSAAISSDQPLLNRVESLSDTASGPMKSSARRLLNKYK